MVATVEVTVPKTSSERASARQPSKARCWRGTSQKTKNGESGEKIFNRSLLHYKTFDKSYWASRLLKKHILAKDEGFRQMWQRRLAGGRTI